MNHKEMLERIFKEYDRRMMSDNKDRLEFIKVMEEVKKEFVPELQNEIEEEKE